MKKAFGLFMVFVIIDLVMLIDGYISNFNIDVFIIFIQLIFLEIAFFGCVIIYKISKKGDDNDD